MYSLKIFFFPEPDCAWCRRTITSTSTEIFGTQDGPRYCSESCFSQSRRASFKRAKTCDWCRHVRHAVSYVDFQDGASQLQFCSDKCLNQYKMQIFCKETQAHLDMNPHLKEKGKGSLNNLITPDLWLKNCRSRSISPKSDRSTRSARSSSPPLPTSIPPSPPPVPVTNMPIQKPLISVAPPSKLMSRPNVNNSRLATKAMRRRRSGRILTTCNNNNTNNNRINNTTNMTVQSNNNSVPKPCTITSLLGENKGNDISQHRPQFTHPYIPNSPSNIFNIRPPIMTPPPRFMNSQSPMPSPLIPDPFHLPPFSSAPPPPPVTILVPYPVLIPLPIPIPIPLPISEFLKAHSLSPLNNLNKSCYPDNNNTNNINLNTQNSTHTKDDTVEEQPLDFTTKTSINSVRENNNENKTNKEKEQEKSKCVSEIRKINDSPPPTSQPQVNLEQKLPKFKITRLNSKRIITPSTNENDSIPAATVDSSNIKTNSPSRESESSRPLRKRKRIIDGEILK